MVFSFSISEDVCDKSLFLIICFMILGFIYIFMVWVYFLFIFIFILQHLCLCVGLYECRLKHV